MENGWIKTFRNGPQTLQQDATLMECLQVETRRHPYLIKMVAAFDSIGRHAVHFEHAARNRDDVWSMAQPTRRVGPDARPAAGMLWADVHNQLQRRRRLRCASPLSLRLATQMLERAQLPNGSAAPAQC